ncbi:hypothetical protein AMJ44_12620 [candidate division WOR-1 bacterium DG_54_3]|uniref:Uncharacterized protein n=1 Tax=candidate division WOR-1 bacterium DG_54_3 TaxID=1703775 RepID=A0A0S7XRN4_UNCSA|nr:MAG: hypothetical protein AMJ44_12620 [candidate division WOR-1 bacterium DG_54_3]
MSQKWKTVRIFISSTFRDMHAERDHLVRFVFPELKEKCRKNHVHLIDVDLRWGVTEADAQDGKALDICLDEIDSCRPYFLGLLGHRYGWVPPGEEHSITAQEIYHGVLHNNIPKQVVDLRRIIEGELEGKGLTNEQINTIVHCYQWEEDKDKYLLREDATDDELEIIRSVFVQYSVYQRDRSFFFFRAEHLTKKLAGAQVGDYFESDKATQDKLVALKQEIVDEGLPWFEYDDIEAFGEKVGRTLWQRIEAELGEPLEKEKDMLEEEAGFHDLFMADRTRRFVGRRDVLDRMHAFCEQQGEPSIIIITGEPGCGKSSLMARFSEEIIHDHPNWVIIPHFIGASPSSTNLRQTLRRLCTHLNQMIESPKEIPEGIKELLQIFPDLLAKVAQERRILIILDALNQFEKTDKAHDMRWLPQQLPENVRFVISTLAGKALDSLLARWLKPKVEEVTGLDGFEIKELVVDYLKEIRHEFPNKQVEKAFFHKMKAGNPLYILVALEELRVFGKFEELPDRVDELPDTVPALFDQMLERIETDFNTELVRDTMVFIACGRQGMTAEELQTLLGAHALRLGVGTESEKFPDMLWARLYRAFRAYLFERSGVIDFFHGQLKEAVGKRYLEREANRSAVHKVIADYFEKRWREPYLRAIEELPHQRTKADDWEGVERILSDYHFVKMKSQAGMAFDLMRDYNQAKDIISSDRIKNTSTGKFEEWAHFMATRVHKIALNAEPFSQLAYNYAARGSVASATKAHALSYKKPWFRLLNRPECPQTLPLQLTMKVHGSSVDSVALTPDGLHAVSEGGGSLQIWDLRTAECIRVLEGHAGIMDMTVTLDGSKVVSYDNERTFRVWDFQSGICLKEIKMPSDWSSSAMAISRDGRKAVCVGKDAIHLWDLGANKRVTTIPVVMVGITEKVAISPDGYIAVIELKTTPDRILSAWDLEKGHRLGIFYKGFLENLPLVVTRDGSRAVCLSGDHTLNVWDIKSGRCIQKVGGGSGSMYEVAIAPDELHAVSWHRWSKKIQLWNLKSGDCLKTLEIKIPYVSAMAVSPELRRVVVGGDKKLRVLDLDSDKAPEEEIFGPMRAIVLTPNGSHTIAGSDRSLQVLDTESGKCLWRNETHAAEVLAVTPDEQKFVSGGSEGTIEVWDLLRGKRLKKLKGHTKLVEEHDQVVSDIAVTPNGRLAISASGWDDPIFVWNLKTGRCIRRLKGHKEMVTSVRVNPDGSRLVSGDTDGTLRVWNVATGRCIHVLKGHSDTIWSLTITPDSRLAISASEDKTLRIWDLKNGNCLRSLIGHTQPVSHVSVTPDSRKAVSVENEWSKRGELFVWDLETGQCILKLKGHTDSIKSVRISDDGRWVISGSVDNTIRLWDLKGGKEIQRFDAENSILTGALESRKLRFAAGDQVGNVYFLKIENIKLGPAIATAWQQPERRGVQFWKHSDKKLLSFGCPFCRKWPEVLETAVGGELPCPNCGEMIKLNPFTINANWRPISKAWR